MPSITHIRGPADPNIILSYKTTLEKHLALLTEDREKWTPAQIDELRGALANLHDALEEAFTKLVNGYRRGDVVMMRDQTVAKIESFLPGDKSFLFRRNNGSTGIADADYIKERLA